MIRTLTVMFAAVVMSSASLAAGRSQPSFKPSSLPQMQESEADLGIMMAPAAPMSMPASPAMSPQQMIDSLSAIKGSRDGSQSEIGAAPRVKRMLMGKQSGMIGGTGDKNNKGDLQQIANTGQYPYTTIGVIASGCTGTIVMKRFVLTAAWCVFDLKSKKFYQNLNFYPAMNGKKTPFGEVQWKNAWVAKGFTDNGDLNFGYGLIELDQDIGDQAGWFGFGDVPKFNFKQLTLTGYPFAGVPAQTMWESRCAIDGAQDSAIFYRCPGNGKSLGAMLGSPIWFKGKADDSWQIVGVHVTSQDDKMNSWWAARLSAAHTETILGWANAGGQTDDSGIDQGTDDQVSDQDTGNTDNPQCTCDDQTQAN